MEVNWEKMQKIRSNAVDKMCELPNKLYWDTPVGRRELGYEELRFIAILKAANMVLDLGLEFDCNEKK